MKKSIHALVQFCLVLVTSIALARVAVAQTAPPVVDRPTGGDRGRPSSTADTRRNNGTISPAGIGRQGGRAPGGVGKPGGDPSDQPTDGAAGHGKPGGTTGDGGNNGTNGGGGTTGGGGTNPPGGFGGSGPGATPAGGGGGGGASTLPGRGRRGGTTGSLGQRVDEVSWQNWWLLNQSYYLDLERRYQLRQKSINDRLLFINLHNTATG